MTQDTLRSVQRWLALDSHSSCHICGSTTLQREMDEWSVRCYPRTLWDVQCESFKVYGSDRLSRHHNSTPPLIVLSTSQSVSLAGRNISTDRHRHRPGWVAAEERRKTWDYGTMGTDGIIPLNFRAPLIFAHLGRAKIKGCKFAHQWCAKIRGARTVFWVREN